MDGLRKICGSLGKKRKEAVIVFDLVFKGPKKKVERLLQLSWTGVQQRMSSRPESELAAVMRATV